MTGARRVTEDAPDDDLIDGCEDGGIMAGDPGLNEEEAELFPLFAEALDPNSPVTIEEVERQWA